MEPISSSYGIVRPFNSLDVAGPTFEDDGMVSTIQPPALPDAHIYMPTVVQAQATNAHVEATSTGGPQLGTSVLYRALFNSCDSLASHSELLAAAMIGIGADGLRDLAIIMRDLSVSVPYGTIPNVLSGVTEVPRMATQEAIRALGARAGAHLAVVPPSHLVDAILACADNVPEPTADGVRIRYKDKTVDIRPNGCVEKKDLTNLIGFAKHTMPTVKSISGILEQVLRVAYCILQYKYVDGTPVCFDMERARDRCLKLYGEFMTGAYLKTPVMNFAMLFRTMFMSRRASCQLALPHVMAAATLHDHEDVNELIKRFCDMQKAVPDPFVNLLNMDKLPTYEFSTLVHDVCPHANQTTASIQYDPVSQGVMGTRIAGVCEITAAAFHMGFAEFSDVIVLTDAAGGRACKLSGLPIVHKIVNSTAHTHEQMCYAVKQAADNFKCVIVTRGSAGAPHLVVGSHADLTTVQLAYKELAASVVNGSRVQRAVFFGPFDPWKIVPDWLKVLSARFEIDLYRTGMDCSPFFMAVCNDNGTKLSMKELEANVSYMRDDLYITNVMRRALIIRGQPNITYEANPMRVKRDPAYLIQIAGVVFSGKSDYAQKLYESVTRRTSVTKCWYELRLRMARPLSEASVKYL